MTLNNIFEGGDNMADSLKIRVSLELNGYEAGNDLAKQINQLNIEPIKVGLKLDPNKVDLTALNQVNFTEVKRKFQDAFSIEGTVVSELKDTMSSIERIINARISTANIVKFQSLSSALSDLGKSFNVDTKVFSQFEKINDTLTQFNALSKEAQSALISVKPNKKFTGNVDDFSNEVAKKYGVSSKQLAQSVEKANTDLTNSFNDIANAQVKSATKYLDVQDGIVQVIKKKYNDWTDLTTTVFTDGTQLGKMTANVETYLNKMEKEYQSVTDKIRKYNIDLHKAISEGNVGDVAKYKSIIDDFEALKKKMVADVGNSPFADRLASEFSRIDALNRKVQDLAISQYDNGMLEKQQKKYLEEVQEYADKVIRLNKEISKAENNGLVDHAKSLTKDMIEARGKLSELLTVDIKDIFPDDIVARTKLKEKATDIINAMDDANNLYNSKIEEKNNKKLQETGLNKFLEEYKSNANELVALENKIATALNGDQLDYASKLQTEVNALRERQQELKENASALASYERL